MKIQQLVFLFICLPCCYGETLASDRSSDELQSVGDFVRKPKKLSRQSRENSVIADDLCLQIRQLEQHMLPNSEGTHGVLDVWSTRLESAKSNPPAQPLSPESIRKLRRTLRHDEALRSKEDSPDSNCSQESQVVVFEHVKQSWETSPGASRKRKRENREGQCVEGHDVLPVETGETCVGRSDSFLKTYTPNLPVVASAESLVESQQVESPQPVQPNSGLPVCMHQDRSSTLVLPRFSSPEGTAAKDHFLRLMSSESCRIESLRPVMDTFDARLIGCRTAQENQLFHVEQTMPVDYTASCAFSLVFGLHKLLLHGSSTYILNESLRFVEASHECKMTFICNAVDYIIKSQAHSMVDSVVKEYKSNADYVRLLTQLAIFYEISDDARVKVALQKLNTPSFVHPK